MKNLYEALGIDLTNPDALRANLLVESDDQLLNALISIRKERGLTQEEVGRRMGVSQPTVAAFETQRDPKLSSIRRYAQAVEALVSHTVEKDDGDLSSSRVHEWHKYNAFNASLDVSSKPSPQAHLVPSVYMKNMAAKSKRTDFTLGA